MVTPFKPSRIAGRCLLTAAAVLFAIAAGTATAAPTASRPASVKPTPAQPRPTKPRPTKPRPAKPAPPKQVTYEIVVPLTNIRNVGKGTLIVRLLTRVDRVGGTERGIRTLRARPASTRQKVVFRGVPAGVYAVFVLHDMDNDGKLDTTFIGLPDEDIAVSRNAGGGPRGGPKWSAASFRHGSAKTRLQPLIMRHFYD